VTKPKRHSRCAICGSDVFIQREKLGLLTSTKLLILNDVKIAQCENCVERYHPFETSQRIHAEITRAIEEGEISSEDTQKLIYVQEPELEMNKTLIDQAVLSCIDAFREHRQTTSSSCNCRLMTKCFETSSLTTLQIF